MNFNIFETVKDSRNTPPSSKFIEHRVHELVWGCTAQQTLRGAKGLDQQWLTPVLPVMTGKYLK